MASAPGIEPGASCLEGTGGSLSGRGTDERTRTSTGQALDLLPLPAWATSARWSRCRPFGLSPVVVVATEGVAPSRSGYGPDPRLAIAAQCWSWGERRDLHPLPPRSQRGASAPSAFVTLVSGVKARPVPVTTEAHGPHPRSRTPQNRCIRSAPSLAGSMGKSLYRRPGSNRLGGCIRAARTDQSVPAAWWSTGVLPSVPPACRAGALLVS